MLRNRIWLVAVAVVVAGLIAGCGSKPHDRLAYVRCPSMSKPSCALIVADAAGRAPRKIAALGFAANSAPAWSPDGTKLAVVMQPRAADSGGVVHVVGADGKGDRALGAGGNPAWSPDGKKLTFNRCHPLPDGCMRRRQLTVSLADGHESVVDSQGGGPASWSPDGRTIAYFTVGDGYGGCGYIGERLFVAPATGGKRVRIAKDGNFSGPPMWLPDGSRVLVGDDSSSVKDPDCHWPVEAVWLIKPDASGRKELDPNGGPVALSPDGKRVLVSHWTRGRTTLSTTGVDGSASRTFAAVRGGSVWAASWSPLGHIAYQVSGGETSSIVVADSSGSSRLRIKDAQFPAWSPRAS